jgi:RNA ligase
MMNIQLLQEMLAQGWVIQQKHPTEALNIYNYSAPAQYERVWNEVTMACRGLILDEKYNIVARPFTKFFNLGEMENQFIPNESFEVYEKMDGSLGIMYWIGDKPFIASRGSFISDQSVVANELLNTVYAPCIAKLDKTKTYLFEIIYPENRIVLQYGETKALVLLGIIDTASGEDLPLEDLGFPLVKLYDGLNDIHALKNLEEENKEGFVVKFKSGYRLKVKFAEYVRIHRIVTQVSSLSIWEYLKTNQSMELILDRVPDEFYDWVKETVKKYTEQYAAIEIAAKAEFKVLETRKETAFYFQTCQFSAVLFSMLDGRDYSPIIWKMLKPKFEKPFFNKE